jgi:anthranilate phosphoribosyltransferase
VFGGDDKGPHRDALLMGTSLVLEVLGMAKDAKQGVEIAASGIDDGAAQKLLANLNAHFGKV